MNLEKIKNYFKEYDIKDDIKKNRFRILDHISWHISGFIFWMFLYWNYGG